MPGGPKILSPNRCGEGRRVASSAVRARVMDPVLLYDQRVPGSKTSGWGPAQPASAAGVGGPGEGGAAGTRREWAGSWRMVAQVNCLVTDRIAKRVVVATRACVATFAAR